MTARSSASLDQIIDGLKRSPLFQLSLASKELFHSNFLAWLCQTHPDHAGRVFATFLRRVPSACEGLRVYRERHNIDLLLEYPGGENLVIENKVKSLPAKEQLEEYTAATHDRTRTTFLLLSLSRPAFLPANEMTIRLSDGTIWRCLTYRELAAELRGLLPHIEAANSYHGQLLRDYIDFIAHLDILSTQFAIDWSDERGDFFGVDSDIRRLQPIRLHDLIDKMRYAQLEQWIGDALDSEGFPVAHGRLCDGHDGQPGQLLIGAGMTRGVGLFDLKYFVMNKHRLGDPVILGVQVQGNQFRLVVETRVRNKAFEIAKALWQQGAKSRLWFDFGLLPGGSGEYPQKRDFNQYSGVFFYRSKKLGSISPKRLADTIIAYVRSIRTNQIAICQQIERVLQNTEGNLTA